MTGLHLFSKPLLEERREEKQQAMRERVLLSLQSFDMKNVRNVDLEYKGEVPMDFNMLNGKTRGHSETNMSNNEGEIS